METDADTATDSSDDADADDTAADMDEWGFGDVTDANADEGD
jgi:flagellar protein FlaI